MKKDLTKIETEELARELQDRGLVVSSPKCHCGNLMEKKGFPGLRAWYCTGCNRQIMNCNCNP